MSAPVDSAQQIRSALDPALRKVQVIPARTDAETVVYCSQPVGQILFLLALSVDGTSGSLTGSYLVEPLQVPTTVSIAQPFRPSRDGVIRGRAAWRVGELPSLAPEIARTASAGLSKLRERYDGAGKFAAAVDHEYLADDWLDLAEAVAYLWFAHGDLSRAVEQLRALAGRDDARESELGRRSRVMSALIESDAESARRKLDAWRERHLKDYDLI